MAGRSLQSDSLLRSLNSSTRKHRAMSPAFGPRPDSRNGPIRQPLGSTTPARFQSGRSEVPRASPQRPLAQQSAAEQMADARGPQGPRMAPQSRAAPPDPIVDLKVPQEESILMYRMAKQDSHGRASDSDPWARSRVPAATKDLRRGMSNEEKGAQPRLPLERTRNPIRDTPTPCKTPTSKRPTADDAQTEQPSAAVVEPKQKSAGDGASLARLQDMFPTWDRQTLIDVLVAAEGNLESATYILLQWTGQVTPHPKRTAPEAGRSPGFHMEGVREQLTPVSPWSDTCLLQLKPAPDTSPQPRILPRPQYDCVIAARLQHKYGGRNLAQLIKVVSHWRGRRPSIEGSSPPSGPLSSPLAKELACGERLSCLTSEEKVREGKKLLSQRCSFLGLTQVEMKDDGNCQFRAISQELFGTQDHHRLVRAEVVAHMTCHSPEYRAYFAPEEWDAYIAKMSQDGEWGDELTLRATADAFEIRIHVVTSTDQNWYLMYQPSIGCPPGREVFLTYIAPIHYNTLEPIR